MRRQQLAFFVMMLSIVLAIPAAAQDTGSGTFAGIVRDASGAVLPGVTVEAASPALIEKVRAVVTDAEGRYRITGLRPGVYSLTFTLPGFRTTRREGLELTTGFIATANAELSVGAVEETITVTGQAPIVDTTNSTQQQVFSDEVVRELPIGKNSAVFATLLPGAVLSQLANQDVGGSKGETENQVGIHGGKPNDGLTFRDGNFDGHMFGGFGANALSSINPATIQEVTLQLTGGLTAEAFSGGIQNNVIIKDGGNVFRGSFLADFGSRNLQGDNIDDALRARGVTAAAFVKENKDLAFGLGGPIKQDKLWFFGDARYWRSFSEYPGIYFNKLQGKSPLYERDLSRPAIGGTYTKAGGIRLTWQATQKNKFTATGRYEDTCNCFFQVNLGLRSPEAAQDDKYHPYRLMQASWTNPLTDKILLQASTIVINSRFVHEITPERGIDRATTISTLDRLTNFRYNAPLDYTDVPFKQGNVTASVTYITGPHAFKVGGMYLRAAQTRRQITNDLSYLYTFAGPVPESVQYFAYPNVVQNGARQVALYAQDQWTIRDLTLSLGVRYDAFNAYAPATHSGAGPWSPARDFPAAKDIVDWKDINPRVGMTYKLFGSDHTALKMNLGRFVPFESIGSPVTFGNVPSNQVVLTATRTWRDTNGDYLPQEEELGPLSNAAFGTPVRNTTYAEDVIHGWGVRAHMWEGSVSVQHELRPGLGLNVGYFRTWYNNFTVTDNTLVTAADFDSYCITGPVDSKLPGGGGENVCGLKTITPSLFGRVSNRVARASDYGKQTEVYNGIDATVNMRFGDGGLLSGGLSTAQTVTDNCEVLAKVPEAALTNAPNRFCHVAPSWSAATQVKLFGSYPLPFDFRVTAVYQNIPGFPTTASYVVTNAQATAALGRPLAGGANATALVELIPPLSLYQEARLNLVNLSFTRSFRVGSRRIQPTIDLHNALNANPVLLMNLRYGPAWRNVQGVLPPRLIKLGVTVDF